MVRECMFTVSRYAYHVSGLYGFARLVPGDNCEMQLKYGSQKWRCKGKIGDTSQLWEPQSFPLKAVIGDVLSIRVTCRPVKSANYSTLFINMMYIHIYWVGE